jgi:glycosyltransferase involved in cell wall biosynthesis
MKILYDYHGFSLQKFGGISRYFVELNKELNKKKINSKIIAPIHKNLHLKNCEFNSKLNFYLNKYPKYTNQFINNYNFYLTNFIAAISKPQIIHQTYYSNKSFYINKKNTKLILTVYDLIHEIFHKDFGFDKNYRPKLFSLKDSDHIICISYKTKIDLMDIYKIPEEKISVIHLAYTKFDDLRKDKIINEPYLLFVGSRKRYKNFFMFLKGFSLSNSLKKDFKIVCFGGNKFDNKELQLINKLGLNVKNIIQIEGGDQILSNLYKNAEAFIFPSLYEGFGLPIIEAMSYGCPVLLSSIEVFKEIADNSGSFFDPNSPDSIKDRIENLVYSDINKEKFITKGYKQIKKFTWDNCANNTLNVYKKII